MGELNWPIIEFLDSNSYFVISLYKDQILQVIVQYLRWGKKVT